VTIEEISDEGMCRPSRYVNNNCLTCASCLIEVLTNKNATFIAQRSILYDDDDVDDEN